MWVGGLPWHRGQWQLLTGWCRFLPGPSCHLWVRRECRTGRPRSSAGTDPWSRPVITRRTLCRTLCPTVHQNKWQHCKDQICRILLHLMLCSLLGFFVGFGRDALAGSAHKFVHFIYFSSENIFICNFSITRICYTAAVTIGKTKHLQYHYCKSKKKKKMKGREFFFQFSAAF